jgi:hypothetical protein
LIKITEVTISAYKEFQRKMLNWPRNILSEPARSKARLRQLSSPENSSSKESLKEGSAGVNVLGAHSPCQRGSRKEGANFQEVEKAINGLRMPKDFKWFKPGLGFTCKAKDIGLGSFAECLEAQSYMCPFSVSFDNSYYCKCFPRVYIATELKK